ncbi:high frequency lysogenization protein HflD [Luteimonas deserti]|uniref:High frequency lysogenization protein HflD homolog n=1 Tax=Luteimonas deserti TaxID=2752306 RepID=A0A7Z0QSX1_9GAMM|nr:high frequency lysogenization protein HflD [Luteimonas deserti]NYZ64329.1 high frequency lysogenization protein HflD [Luteimonas deserti]
MSNPIDDRVLALAALAQALQQVRTTAESGQSRSDAAGTVIASVFRIDADSVADVYGGVPRLHPGLRLLRDILTRQQSDDGVAKLAMSVLRLERRFSDEPDVIDAVADGVRRIAPRAEAEGATHPDVLNALGGLYAETISQLRPRVMVQGAPHYLGQASVVAEIRALLLAAVRAAVLWRQLGGSQWELLLGRSRMLEAIGRMVP